MPNPGLLQSLAQTNPAAGINQGLQGLSSNFQNQIQMGLMVQDQQMKQQQFEMQKKQQKLDTGFKYLDMSAKYADIDTPWGLEQSAKQFQLGVRSIGEANGQTDFTDLNNMDLSSLASFKPYKEVLKNFRKNKEAYDGKIMSFDELQESTYADITGLNKKYDDLGKTLTKQIEDIKTQQKNTQIGNAINKYNAVSTPVEKSQALNEIYKLDTKIAMDFQKENIPKEYTPQLTPYKETATGKIVYLDANNSQDIGKIKGGGYEPHYKPEKATPVYGQYKAWEDVMDKRMRQLNSKYKLTGSEATDIDPNNPNALLALFMSKGLTADSAKKYLEERDVLENTRAGGYSDIEAGISPYKKLGSPKPKTGTFEQGVSYLKSAKDTADAVSKIGELRKRGWSDEQINELKRRMTGR